MIKILCNYMLLPSIMAMAMAFVSCDGNEISNATDKRNIVISQLKSHCFLMAEFKAEFTHKTDHYVLVAFLWFRMA